MKAPGGNRNVRWVILHGYSPTVNHSHLKKSSLGNRVTTERKSEIKRLEEREKRKSGVDYGLCNYIL